MTCVEGCVGYTETSEGAKEQSDKGTEVSTEGAKGNEG